MKIFQLDTEFILDNINSFIKLEDYVPFDFSVYGFQSDRDEFLESKDLLKTMREMDVLLNKKCKHSQHPILAHDSIMIEWLNCHPEFEGILTKESFIKYQNMKNNSELIDFIDLLYDIELPSEKVNGVFDKFEGIDEYISIKDDSNIKYPDFNMKKKFLDEYSNTLLGDYLAYLV